MQDLVGCDVNLKRVADKQRAVLGAADEERSALRVSYWVASAVPREVRLNSCRSSGSVLSSPTVATVA